MAADVAGPWEGLTIAGGRYERLTTIGVGGMGFVYRAVDRNLKTDVVIKSPRAQLVEGPELADRFEQEVGALVRLSFPHIVPIIDIGRHEGVSFAVMRYLPGGNLVSRAMIGAGGRPAPMPWQSMRYWLPSIAKALDFVHRSQFVHRDVKPRNILFDEHGQAYLSDFGIIKGIGLTPTGESRFRTADGINVGTVDYMAPEVLKNQEFDGRADQYSLALTVYEYLAGRLPYGGESVAAVIDGHLNQLPRPLRELVPETPASISLAVAKALSKHPADRFRDCGDFARAVLGGSTTSLDLQTGFKTAAPAAGLRGGASGETLTAQPVAPSSSKKFFATRGGAAVLAAGFALAAAGVLAVALKWEQPEPILGVDVNPLARRISEWKHKAADVERNRTVDSEPILKELEYDDADDLQALLTAQASTDRRDYIGKLDELEGELTTLAEQHRDRTIRLAELSAAAPPKSTAEGGSEADQFAAERRELEEQSSELTTMAFRLKSLRENSHTLDAYDAAALLELTQLNEMEAVVAATEPRPVSAAVVERATVLASGPNPRLAWLAVNVLARSGGASAVRLAVARFDSYPVARQGELVWSLLLSGDPAAIAAALRPAEKKPDVLRQISRTDLLELAERDAAKYSRLIDLLLVECASPEERLRIFIAQSQALGPEWLAELETACTTGLLRDYVDDVVEEIILREREAAYPLAERLLSRSSVASFERFTGAELAALAADSPALAGVMAVQWVVRGGAELRKTALEQFCRADSQLPLEQLQAALAGRSLRDPDGLANLLIVQTSKRGVSLAEHALRHLKGLDPAKTAYATASTEVLHARSARDALLELAWKDVERGRPWVVAQILGAGFLAKFGEAEVGRVDQQGRLDEILPILGGKLVVLPNSAANVAGERDRGLQIELKNLLKLPEDVDVQKFAPDGPLQTRLGELRSELAQLRTTTPEEFGEPLAALDAYLERLEALNRTAHQLALVYDFTILKQLPGMKRTMRINPTPTWDFRFASVHIALLERERAAYLKLAGSLSQARSAVPIP